ACHRDKSTNLWTCARATSRSKPPPNFFFIVPGVAGRGPRGKPLNGNPPVAVPIGFGLLRNKNENRLGTEGELKWWERRSLLLHPQLRTSADGVAQSPPAYPSPRRIQRIGGGGLPPIPRRARLPFPAPPL